MSDTQRSADAPPATEEGKEEANPKRLVVFCDGTWNNLAMPHLTNVARLAKCVQPTGRMEVDGEQVTVPQVVYYDEGVGLGDGISWTSDRLTRVLGGAFGRGLDSKIEKAYRFIVLNYNPGDELFIFGFSRGAYTARSLCGLIRKAGILRRSAFNRVGEAMALYRNGLVPSHADAQAFRRLWSHPIVAGDEDYTDTHRTLIAAFRRRAGVSPEVRVIPPELRRLGIHIRYLGVWDTVGALGVPSSAFLLSKLTRERYSFHDHKASTLVERLRHAVSLDEERAAFDVTPVENIHELNTLWAASSPGLHVEEAEHAGEGRRVAYADRPYQQRWFPGDHGAVGGGNIEPGLSSGALLWVAEGAADAGLALDYSPGSELAEAERLEEPGANWRVDRNGQPLPAGHKDLVAKVSGTRRRLGPQTFEEIHESAVERWRRYPEYRPSGMQRFAGSEELEANDEDC